MKKIRWAVIGAGGIADRRAIPALLEDPTNEIVAIMDKVPAVAEVIAKKYGFENYFSDEEEMLRTIECDAVYIATPVFCHYRQSMLALKYGANVFMEKPLSMNAAEGAEILDAFQKADRQLVIGYMMGYHNLHQKASEIIKNGDVGDVSLVKMQFSCWYPEIPGAWRQNKSLSGGGCIMDLAVHCMELFTSITDQQIKTINAMFTNKTFSYEVEDTAVITFQSDKGILGHIDVNFNVPDAAAPSRLEIYGTAGSIICEGTMGQTEEGTLKHIYAPQAGYEAQQSRAGEAKISSYAGEGSNIYTKQFRQFGQLLMANTRDYTNAKRALNIQKLCDTIYCNNGFQS